MNTKQESRRHAVILCDGEPPTRHRLLRHLRATSLFIAADGAGNLAAEYALRPHHVVGDLDSYRPGSWPDLEPLHVPDEETNDLEKALELALLHRATSAVVLGATGRRLDHTLKNLSVLKAYHHKLELYFEDEYATIRLVRQSLVIHGRPGQVVSLFPLSGRVDGITTRGLEYPLYNEPLENGVRDGSSNEMTGEEARVEVTSGDLLVFVNHPGP